MSYISFDKSQLVNLEFSLNREVLRANRAGSYANSTIVNCNTRKYHGLLVTPQPGIDHENHVLLSALDETVIQMDAEFNLGLRKYPGGKYNPKGHKYIRHFDIEPYPRMTYRIGGVILTKEMVFISREDRMIIKYTLEEAHSPTRLKFTPFLAFRNIHTLSKENIFVDKKYENVANGIKVRMYQGYTELFLQFSKPVEYVHVPDWYYNVEYQEEMERGYDYQEDLYVPGFFEVEIACGESIWFSAGTQEIKPSRMHLAYNSEQEKRVPRDCFRNCLLNAAQQFVVGKGKNMELLAGFPWFGRSGRSTMVSLPGLMMVTGDIKTAKAIIDTMVSEMKGPFFPLFGSGSSTIYGAADTSLWFFWTLQQYAMFSGEKDKIWKEYGRKMKLILENYRDGTEFNIHAEPDGLIHAAVPGMALTWMDAFAQGKPVTQRPGKVVEINALWYNAIRFSLELAEEAGDQEFVEAWHHLADRIPESFVKVFWNPAKKYLADYVDGEYKDWTVRPNMVIVASLPYSPVSEEIRKEVLSRVRQELMTPRGLRTLTPKSPVYKGVYAGNQNEREAAYHQGSISPWLTGHFVEGYLKIHGRSGLTFVKNILAEFEPVVGEHGIGTISELYDGDPPHHGRGAISQASSVAEVLRMGYLIDMYK